MYFLKIYVKINLYFNIYLFYMKKINTFLFIVLLLILFFDTSFAADNLWSKELEQSSQNISIITSFFSTELLLNIIFATISLIWTIILSKIVTAKVVSYLESIYSWETWGREELVWLLARTTNISILSIWFVITLTILWVDLWIFLAWLWFGIWFTLKIFLSNFISWILMVTQWYYHNWDIIQVGERIWKIHKIHALFTAVEQFDWVIYFVPNIKFLEEDIVNYNTNDKRRVEIEFRVDYDTNIVKAKQIMVQVLEKFPNILNTPSSQVIVNLWENSVNLMLMFWINTSDSFLSIKSNVTETINLAFRQNWINIPFNQITISSRDDKKITNI